MFRWILALWVSAAVATAAARPAVRTPVEVAKDFIKQGDDDYNAERFADALDKYRRAYAASGWQEIWYYLGLCHEKLSQPDLALTAYHQFLAYPEAPANGRQKAEEKVALLQQKLATGTVILAITPETTTADIAVDGQSVGHAPLDPLSLPKGHHAIIVKAPGYADAMIRIDVPGAETIQLQVALQSLPAPTQPPVPVCPSTICKRPAYAPWKWSLLGSGAALAVAGAVTYGLGERDHRDIVDARNVKPGSAVGMNEAQARSLEDSGDRKKAAGYALMGAGGGVLIGATVLFILDAIHRPQKAHLPVATGITPVSGGTMLSLEGRF